MEENQRTSSERKKSQALRFNVGGGGGVLGGVVLLGGGLAVAGLLAAFSIIKNKNSGKHDRKNDHPLTAPEKTQDGNEGLSFFLQNPVHQKSCCANHGTSTIGVTESPRDSWEVASAHNVAMGDKPLSTMDEEKENPLSCDQEILFSDDLKRKQERIESCNKNLKNEESLLPASGNMIMEEFRESLQLKKTAELKIEEKPAAGENLPTKLVKEEEDDDDSSEGHAKEKEEENTEEESALKENSLILQSVEEQEEDDNNFEDNDDNEDEDNNDDHDDISEEDVTQKAEDSQEDISEDVTEKEEESSEVAGSSASSRDSNVEAIWPTEMIEALSQELKVMKANDHNSGEKIAKAETRHSLNCKSNGNIYSENSTLLNKGTNTTQELVRAKVETIHLPRREVYAREVYVWYFLLVFFLLLLLHIHRTAPVYDLSQQNSVVHPRV